MYDEDIMGLGARGAWVGASTDWTDWIIHFGGIDVLRKSSPSPRGWLVTGSIIIGLAYLLHMYRIRALHPCAVLTTIRPVYSHHFSPDFGA